MGIKRFNILSIYRSLRIALYEEEKGMKKRYGIIWLSLLLFFLISKTSQEIQVHGESDLPTEIILEEVVVSSPDANNVISIFLGIEKVMKDFQEQLNDGNNIEYFMVESFQKYAISGLWDYMTFLYDVYDQIPFPYGIIAVPDLEQNVEYLYTENEKYFYQISFKIFPQTSEEFLAQGIVCLELDQDRNEWVITKISQPYNDLMYYYFPDLIKAIESSDEYFFNYTKMEKEILSQEILDGWLQIAGQFDVNQKISILSANKGYILADSSKRILTEGEISQLDSLESYFAIQEIYARKGKNYQDYILHFYFTMKDWYSPWEKTFSNEEITEIEKQNIVNLMKNIGKSDENDYIEAGTLYRSETKYGLSDEEADDIIAGIYYEIKNMMEPDMTKIIDEENPNRPHLLIGEPNIEEMKAQLLEYVEEDALESVYSIMKERGIHYSQLNDSYYVYLAGEFIFNSIDSLRPFQVLGEDKNGYKIEVPLWIGSVYGTGRSRAYIWLKQNEWGKWKIADIIMDVDKILGNDE